MENFKKVKTEFHSIIDKFNKKDDKCKVLDTFEYFKTKARLLRVFWVINKNFINIWLDKK